MHIKMQVQAHVLHTAACRFSHSHDVNQTHVVNEPFGDANGFGHSHPISVNFERIQNRRGYPGALRYQIAILKDDQEEMLRLAALSEGRRADWRPGPLSSQ